MIDMNDVTSETFENEVLKSDKPVVVDFWAEWCGPCRIFEPVLKDIEKKYNDKVKFVRLNVDENMDIAAKYGIMNIPTTLLFENGEVKAMSVGAVPKDYFEEWLKSNL